MTTRTVRPFVHLRVLSSYSLGLGLSTPADICRHARRSGYSAVALTDVSGTYGFVEFHRAAREVGVKPIYGTLVFLDWRARALAGDPVQSLILLALDRTGLRNVCAVASASAVSRERGGGLSAHDLDGLSDGVIAVTGVDPRASGVAPRHLLTPLHELFGDRLFLECRVGLVGEAAGAQAAALRDAAELGVPPVLVQDVRFVGPPRPQLFDLMAGLDEPGFEHRVFSDRRAGGVAPDHGMLTASEISDEYDEMPEAFTNAALIAALVQPDLFDALESEQEKPAMMEMFAGDPQRAGLRARVGTAAGKRVARELDLIEKAGLEPMFLRFADLVRRLRDAGVRVGPATGLSLQSLCAYRLGVTSFDPYAVDPRFEPGFEVGDRSGRVFDLQIAPEDRPAALAIVNRAFEGASIGYVPTVEHITAARALRIVARRAGAPAAEVEDAIRAASRQQGATLRELAEENRTIGALSRKSAAFRELVAHAAAIEGLPYGFARTKRTVVVSPRPLRDFFAHTVSPDTGEYFVQATRDSFPLGAVLRLDLATLYLLGLFPSDADYAGPLDASVYPLVETDDLEGIHLLEGPIGRLAATFGIASFGDLVNFVALLRHRGTGMTLPERFFAFRDTARPVPAADRVGDVLEPTRGWILFADQMRDVVVGLTGLSRAAAIEIVARFANHDPGSLATLRREFFALTVEQSVSLEDATRWFARLVRKSLRVADRQRVIAECLLIHRCLELKAADHVAFLTRLAEHAGDEKRERYRKALEAEPASRRARAGVADGAPRRSGGGDGAATGPARTGQARDRAASPGGAEPGPPMPRQRGGSVTGPGRASRAEKVAQEAAGGNLKGGFGVLSSVSEFYPHPTSTPVELAGRVRNLQTFNSSSGKKVGLFELFDSSGFVRVFVPSEPLARLASVLSEGRSVVVRGKVRQREGRKMCDAMEIAGSEGGNGRGEASADDPPTRNP